MVDSARSKAFDSISITEHISQFAAPRNKLEFGSVHTKGRMFSHIEEYLLEFRKVPSKNPTVNKGLEVDYIRRFRQEIAEYVNERGWDILLLSVHELRDGLDVEDTSRSQDKESSERRWVQYIELQKEGLQSDFLPYNVLTHPVRLGRSSRVFPSNLDELLIELAEVARTEDRALELNGNDLTRDYKLVEKLAQACSAGGCKVSFGSDAHDPSEVGRGYEKALELVDRFGLEQLTLPQR